MTSWWSQNLLPCTLAGYDFPFVRFTEREPLGLVAHEYPFRSGADLEAMGRGAARWQLVGAFFRGLRGYSDRLYPERFEALRRRLRRDPLTQLQHPTLGLLDVGASEMSTEFDVERVDGQFLTIDLVENGHVTDLSRGGVPSRPESPRTDASTYALAARSASAGQAAGFDLVGDILALEAAVNAPLATVDQVLRTFDRVIATAQAQRDGLRVVSIEAAPLVSAASRCCDALRLWRDDTLTERGAVVDWTATRDADVYAVAASLYRDSTRAADIFRLNPSLPGVIVRRGATLRVPRP